MHSFRRVFGDPSKSLRKLYVSMKFPYQEIKWTYGILCSASHDPDILELNLELNLNKSFGYISQANIEI